MSSKAEVIRRINVLEQYVRAVKDARGFEGTRCGCGAVEMGSPENTAEAVSDLARTKAWVIEAIEEWCS